MKLAALLRNIVGEPPMKLKVSKVKCDDCGAYHAVFECPSCGHTVMAAELLDWLANLVEGECPEELKPN